jgi:ribosomal-protein-alanine N-acetyltransferase
MTSEQPAEPDSAAAATVADLEVASTDYLLRFATPDDAEQLFTLGSDPAVTRFFSWGPYTSIDQPLNYIERLAASRASGERLEFVIVDRAEDAIVGVTGLTEFSQRDRRAVVSSWLGHRYWGTGVNLVSKSLILGLGFRQLGLERISSYSHVRNGRSKAALDRIGFVTEGILHSWHRHGGEPQDVHIHCLMREVYERTELASDEISITGQLPAPFQPSPPRSAPPQPA